MESIQKKIIPRRTQKIVEKSPYHKATSNDAGLVSKVSFTGARSKCGRPLHKLSNYKPSERCFAELASRKLIFGSLAKCGWLQGVSHCIQRRSSQVVFAYPMTKIP